MTSELCKHGFVVCEDCAFERGQMWAIDLLRAWESEAASSAGYSIDDESAYDQCATELTEAMERLKLEEGFHDS